MTEAGQTLASYNAMTYMFYAIAVAAIVVGVCIPIFIYLRRRIIQLGFSNSEHLAQDKQIRDAVNSQADAITWVIGELDTHPATYSTFPADLRAKLDETYEIVRNMIEPRRRTTR